MKTLADISKEDREKIIDIFDEDGVKVHNEIECDEDNINYFIVKLDDDIDDQFYDHSVPFTKIFKQLSCIMTGFQYNNDFYQKGDVNTYYGIWFNKLKVKN